MIQSRFFYSSLQELQLNIKEIYSLQGRLRESIAIKTKKAIRLDNDKSVYREPSLTPEPTTFTTVLDTSVPVSIPAQIEIAANAVPSIEQVLLNQPQPQPRLKTISTPTRGSGIKAGQITKNIPIENSDKSLKNTTLQNRILPFWVVFVIWEICALLVLIFLIL